VGDVLENERSVDDGRGLVPGGDPRGRNDREVDGHTLEHVLDRVFFRSDVAGMMKFDIEGTLVVLFQEFCELLDGLEIDVILRKHGRANHFDGLDLGLSRLSLGSFLGTAREGVSGKNEGQNEKNGNKSFHVASSSIGFIDRVLDRSSKKSYH